MKFSFKKSFLSIFLVSVFLLTSLSPLTANSFGNFTVDLKADASNGIVLNTDLSNVKIDVYESTLSRYEPSADAYIYGHEYSHSVYTNSKGSVTFAKPSARFMVKIDIATLPSGLGIENNTVFYDDTLQKKGSFVVSAVADFKISCDSSMENGVRVDIFNAYDQKIKADYTVTPAPVANAKSSVLASTYQISGSVTVGNIVKCYDFVVENNSDPLGSIANALESNRISKEEALDLYLELFASGYDTGFCATPIIIQLMPFYEDTAFFDQLPTEKQEALLAMVAPPSPTTRATYYTPSGRFAITHEGSTASPTLIVDIGAALEASYSLFVSTLGYQQPASSTSSSVYNVTITSTYHPNSQYILGGCVPFSNGTSQIIYYGISNLNVNISNNLLVTTAHEYMHAIMNTYQFLDNVPYWYNEAFATWAAIRQHGTVGSQFFAGHINEFLGSTSIPLSCFNNSTGLAGYGAVLLPLYMYKNHGGDSTIKGIITRAASSTNVYTNIDNALPGSATFLSVFQQFTIGNYVTHSTYSPYAITSGSNPWYDRAHYEYYNYWNRFAYGDGPHALDAWTSHFMEFAIVGSTLNITVGDILGGNTSGLLCFFCLRTSGGSIVTVDMTDAPYTNYSLVISSSGYVEGCVIPINIESYYSVSYELTVYQY